MFATRLWEYGHEYCYYVSIPFRGFRCLQHHTLQGEMLVQVEFQSLSGVLGVCNMMKPLSGLRSWYLFQSLSGVLGVCNSEAEKIIKQAQKQFQSLSGVLGVCNIGALVP